MHCNFYGSLCSSSVALYFSVDCNGHVNFTHELQLAVHGPTYSVVCLCVSVCVIGVLWLKTLSDRDFCLI